MAAECVCMLVSTKNSGLKLPIMARLSKWKLCDLNLMSFLLGVFCSTLQCPTCPYGLRIVQASLCGLGKIIAIALSET
jgi:hypothetical protein